MNGLTRLSIPIACMLSVAVPAPARTGQSEDPAAGPAAWIFNLSDGAGSVRSSIEAAGGEVLFDLAAMGVLVARGLSREAVDAIVAVGGVDSVGGDMRFGNATEGAHDGCSPDCIAAESIDSSAEPLFSNQWGMRLVKADLAHAAGYTGRGARVAVLDTGIYYPHPDLSPNYLGGHNFFAPFCSTFPAGGAHNCDPGNPLDEDGHGTLVAGSIAAAANGYGIIGVAPRAGLLAVKVCGQQTNCPVSAILAGIAYAVENDADVLNISLGGFVDMRIPEEAAIFEAMKRAMNNAHSRGSIVVQGSGNEGLNLDAAPDYIRRARGEAGQIMVVSALGPDGLAATNGGVPYSNSGGFIDIAGPGGNGNPAPMSARVFSTCSPLSTRLPCSAQNPFRFPGFGASFATAHVSGAAALVAAQLGRATGHRVFKRLIRNADDIGAAGKDPVYGYGRLNVWSALQDVRSDEH